MSVTLTSFRARFPEFAGVPDARVQIYIDEAIADLDQGIWDSTATADRATSLLAAHRVANELDSSGNATGGQGGFLTSASADGVSSSYAMPTGLSTLDAQLWSTQYGQRFLELRNRFTAGPILVG